MKKKNIKKSSIAKRAWVDDYSVIENSEIGADARVTSSNISDSVVGNGTTVGPYASIKKGSVIGKGCRVGNFVEIKNSSIGDNTKIAHLSYVGDSVVGKDCNIGCGVVFANYDGRQKHKIVVEDQVFIGCNSVLIAPITIAKGTYICAGSIVTKDTNPDDFVIGRTDIVVKPERGHIYYGDDKT